MVISIENAVYIDGYKIAFRFSDGVNKTVDFEPFLKSSSNPMITKFLDIKRFRDFKIVHGDLMWNDYEMCFPIWDLYKGNI
ncbi:DUF2442 domain-containing protein [Marixanthomonas spongiae]|uniref:DUF2442 domain-containing protein n=1 Tax=Marixanthomonas spongiae TaxID=2174845 RepID=A0A2U0I5Q7_9FLAO|nr:DUF2442 domain-containing protein [Marixanthomonas spongiae]PVW16429.1 DUF2442 domain-containing protein [Marixanthomonas spongiae]